MKFMDFLLVVFITIICPGIHCASIPTAKLFKNAAKGFDKTAGTQVSKQIQLRTATKVNENLLHAPQSKHVLRTATTGNQELKINPIKALNTEGGFQGRGYFVENKEIKKVLAKPKEYWRPYHNKEGHGKGLFQTQTQLYEINVGKGNTWNVMRVIAKFDKNGRHEFKGVVVHTPGMGNFFEKAQFYLPGSK